MICTRKPKISVLMSVYKEHVAWMRLSIDSILNQTYSDFEFIIVNDKPDREENSLLLNEYAQKDNRIKIITNEQNIGLTKSLNIGLSLAQGEYIARMDADDISMPERFEKQLKYMESHPKIVACGSYIRVINEQGMFVEKRKVCISPIDIRCNLIFKSPIVHPASMFRKIVDDRPVQYNENRRYSQDYALWIDLSRKNNIANIPQYLLKYRESESQISTKKHDAQQECAIHNSEDAISALGLVISEQDKSVILGLTRVDNYMVSPDEAEQAILNLKTKNNKNNRIDINRMLNTMVLIYSNYLPKHYSFWYSLHRYTLLSYRLRHFSIYSFLSMTKKYIIR